MSHLIGVTRELLQRLGFSELGTLLDQRFFQITPTVQNLDLFTINSRAGIVFSSNQLISKGGQS